MARHDRIARPIRVLCLAILGVQLGAAAALAQTAYSSSTQAPGQERVTAQAAAGAPAVVPPTTSPTVPTTIAPAPVTTVAPAPRTVVPAPTTTAPRPAVKAAPAPAPAPAPPTDPAVRVQATYEAVVPAAWRDAIAVNFKLIEGDTSWAAHDGTIQIGSVHYNGSDALLKATIAHEFGHLIAFRYGSQAFNGAAPEGWPAYSSRPEEAWADCVSRAFSGVNDPSHGLPACSGDSLSWTASWVSPGPDAHPVTGA